MRTAAAALFSFAAGAGLAVSMGYGEASISSGLVSTFVVAAAVAVPGPVSYRAGIVSAMIATVGLLIAEIGTGSPALAGLAMALVCLVTSLSYAGGKTAKVVGLMLGTAYFLPAVLGLVDQVGAATVAELGAIGLAAGLLIALTLAGVERLAGRTPEKAEGKGPADDEPSAAVLMWRELRAFGPDARSGLRRALLLGIAMGAYQADGDHNLFWILLTMYIVLQPDLERTWNKALSRSAGTVGAIAQMLAAQHPDRVAGLVLTNCDALDVYPPFPFTFLPALARMPWGIAPLGATMRLKPVRWATYRLLTNDPIPDTRLKAWLQPSGSIPGIRRDADKVIGGLEKNQANDAAEKLRGFEKPVLFSWGERDRFFKPELARRLAAMLPNARIKWVPEGRTFVAIDDPETVSRHIVEFMNESIASGSLAGVDGR